MPFKFEKLEIWKLSMRYGEDIFQMTKSFPKEEVYNLTSQINRAVDSVALNIAEGSIGQSDAEQKRFLSYSIRSVGEVVICLYKAKARKYIKNEIFKEQYSKAETLIAKIQSFKSKLN